MKLKLRLYASRFGQSKNRCFDAGRALARAQAALDEAQTEKSFGGVLESLGEAFDQYKNLERALPGLKTEKQTEDLRRIIQRLRGSRSVPKAWSDAARLALGSVDVEREARRMCGD